MPLAHAQNRSLSGADPKRTFAFVVAADIYEMTDSQWGVPQALTAALDLVCWLRKSDVPESNIHLLSGATQCPELQGVLAPDRWQRATHYNLDKTLTEKLSGPRGDLLIVFWSGHGEMSRRDRRLYLPEMTDRSPKNISVAQLLECLGTSSFQFQEQAVFIDACAGFRKVELDAYLPLTRNGKETYRCLYSLSTSEGFKSSPGVFGKALLETFGETGWPPRFDEACESMTQKLLNLDVQLPNKRSISESGSLIGSGSHRRCDRDEPTNRFHSEADRYLNGKRKGPLVSLVYGSEEQKPDSLVIRLIEDLTVKCGYSGEPFKVSWDSENDKQIRDRLAGALGMPSPPNTAAELHGYLLGRRQLPVTIIRHIVPAWSPATTEVLARYLRFWSAWPQVAAQPHVFVFLETMDPYAMRRAWWRRIAWFFSGGPFPDPVRLAVRRAKCETFCHVIGPDDLGPVVRGHLHAYYVEHDLENSGLALDTLFEKVFGNREQSSMREVEARLRELQGMKRGAFAG